MKKTSGPVDLHSKLESNENETVERGPSPLTSPRPDHVRPIIVNNNGSAHSKEDIQPTSAGSSSAATTPKTTRHAKLRLSISNFTNNSLPSIHGRSAQLNTTPGGKQKQRLSTHQRNLSLDFRYDENPSLFKPSFTDYIESQQWKVTARFTELNFQNIKLWLWENLF